MSSADDNLVAPSSVAIIMDGNGRWAEQRGLPRLQGHVQGRLATRRAVQACDALGVAALTVYAFSVENWRRPTDEVAGLFDLMTLALEQELSGLCRNNIRLVSSGRIGELPEELQLMLARVQRETAGNTGMVFNLLINYGGRAEIVDAARGLAAAAAAGEITAGEVSEELLARHLYHPELPDPDLIIRTGGQYRLSNFLLWQAAYAELVTLEVLWPDFTEEHLRQAFVEYHLRRRRFGGLGGQVKSATAGNSSSACTS